MEGFHLFIQVLSANTTPFLLHSLLMTYPNMIGLISHIVKPFKADMALLFFIFTVDLVEMSSCNVPMNEFLLAHQTSPLIGVGVAIHVVI